MHHRQETAMKRDVNQKYNTNSSILENPYSLSHTEREIIRNVWTIGSPIILIIGTIDYIMSIIIFSRKRMRNRTLGIADLLSLLGLLRYYIREITYVDIRNTTENACKLHTLLVYCMRHFTAWILVTVPIERFIAVWYPFKANIICTKRNGAFALTAVGVIIFSVNAHYLCSMKFKVTSSNSTTSCICIMRSSIVLSLYECAV